MTASVFPLRLAVLLRFKAHPLCIVALVCLLAATALPLHADNAAEIRRELFSPSDTEDICPAAGLKAAEIIASRQYEEWQVVREWQIRCEDSEYFKLYQLAIEPDGSTTAPIDRALKIRMDLSRRDVKIPEPLQELLRTKAEAANPLTEDGKITKEWLMNGYYAYSSRLRAATAGKLHEWDREDQVARSDNLAYEMSLTGGTWLPSGDLARLGNQPAIGMLLSLSLMRISIGMRLDFRFGESPDSYRYFNPNTNSMQTTSRVNSLYMAADIRYDFLRLGAFSMLASLGLGYDNLTHYAATRYSGEKPAMSDSFSTALGLVLRYYFNEDRTFFSDLSFNRHFVSFDTGAGADSLSGNYTTILFAFGMKLLTTD